MTDLIHVRHPYPVRFVPKGGSKEAIAFGQAVTPVRLREVDRRDLEGAAMLDGGDGHSERLLHAFEGRLWFELLDERHVPFSQGDLAALLMGDKRTFPYQSDLANQFGQTPLSALGPQGFDRGFSLGLERPRHIVESGEERARADLLRYLEREVVVADGTVFGRCQGPLAYLRDGFDKPRFHVVEIHGHITHDECFARLDRLEENWEFQRTWNSKIPKGRSPFPEAKEPRNLRLTQPLEDFPFGLLEDDDLRHAARVLPRLVLRDSEAPMRKPPEDEAARARLDARLPVLRRWADLGRMGAIRDEEMEQVFLDVRAHIHDVFSAHPHSRRLGDLKRPYAYVGQLALPRLLMPDPVAPEDDEAMASIGMGPR